MGNALKVQNFHLRASWHLDILLPHYLDQSAFYFLSFYVFRTESSFIHTGTLGDLLFVLLKVNVHFQM